MLKCITNSPEGKRVRPGYESRVVMPAGWRTVRELAWISSPLGGGSSSRRTMTAAAGMVGSGMVASAKNWFWAETQNTLLEPARYSVWGVLENTPKTVVLVLK